MIIEQPVGSLDTARILIAYFQVGDAAFGIDASRVQEVIELKKLTRVHRSTSYIRGVMNLRGKVVTTIDLGEKLAMGVTVENDDSRIIIVKWTNEHVGLLVEKMLGAVKIERDSIIKPPENVHGVQASLITGVFKSEEGMLVALLDVDGVLKVETGGSTTAASLR